MKNELVIAENTTLLMVYSDMSNYVSKNLKFKYKTGVTPPPPFPQNRKKKKSMSSEHGSKVIAGWIGGGGRCAWSLDGNIYALPPLLPVVRCLTAWVFILEPPYSLICKEDLKTRINYEK